MSDPAHPVVAVTLTGTKGVNRLMLWSSRAEVLHRPTPVMNSYEDHVLHDRVLGGETLHSMELVRYTKEILWIGSLSQLKVSWPSRLVGMHGAAVNQRSGPPMRG
jgi:hypothetical protein